LIAYRKVSCGDAHAAQNPSRSQEQNLSITSTNQIDAGGETSYTGNESRGEERRRGKGKGRGEGLTASGLPMMLATAVEASPRMAEVSTPSRLTFVDTFRHGILGGSDLRFAFLFFLLALGALLSAPPVRPAAFSASASLSCCLRTETDGKDIHLAGPKLGGLGPLGSQVFPAPWAWPSGFLVLLSSKKKRSNP